MKSSVKKPELPSGEVDLEPRAVPTQQRAQELVDKILEVTGVLLDEVGLDALNTNLIAERAGVRVASVYRYFPNKFAIVAALARRLTDRDIAVLAKFGDPSYEARDLEDLVAQVVDAAFEIELEAPGIVALRRALRGAPELREIERKEIDRMSEAVIVALQLRGATISRGRVTVVGRLLTETVAAWLDVAMSLGPRNAKYVSDEIKLFLCSYLENYLPDDAALSPRKNKPQRSPAKSSNKK